MGCIYRIINKIDGKSYVGQYCKDNPKQRFTNHKSRARKEDSTEYLYRAIRKHGLENFDFTLICICDNNELNDLEIKYIKEIGREDLGQGTLINLSDGGGGSNNPSKETRKKILPYLSISANN